MSARSSGVASSHTLSSALVRAVAQVVQMVVMVSSSGLGGGRSAVDDGDDGLGAGAGGNQSFLVAVHLVDGLVFGLGGGGVVDAGGEVAESIGLGCGEVLHGVLLGDLLGCLPLAVPQVYTITGGKTNPPPHTQPIPHTPSRNRPHQRPPIHHTTPADRAADCNLCAVLNDTRNLSATRAAVSPDAVSRPATNTRSTYVRSDAHNLPDIAASTK